MGYIQAVKLETDNGNTFGQRQKLRKNEKAIDIYMIKQVIYWCIMLFNSVFKINNSIDQSLIIISGGSVPFSIH